MPRYELPAAADGSEQWIELKDRADITRKEIRATRLAFDTDGGFVEKSEAHTELVLVNCLQNWQIKAHSNDVLPVPQRNIKEVQRTCAAIPVDTWFALERVINGQPSERGDGGYTKECLRVDEGGEEDPQRPSNA